jgi:hypothetical protein
MLYRIALVIWIPLKRHLPLAHYVWSLFYPSAISSRWTLLKSTTHRSTTCIAEYPCPERLCSPEAKLVHVSLNIVGLHILFSEKKNCITLKPSLYYPPKPHGFIIALNRQAPSDQLPSLSNAKDPVLARWQTLSNLRAPRPRRRRLHLPRPAPSFS